MRFTLLCIAVTAMLQLPTAALTGRVLDPSGAPIPGATVRISGASHSATVVSDPTGRFPIGERADGPYSLSVSLAGFRTQTLDVPVDPSANPEIVVTLSPGILAHVDWIIPPPADAYRIATAVVHLRIDGTRQPGPCGHAQVVTARHRAVVLRTFKGQMPATIDLQQPGAGRCSDGAQWHEGATPPYRTGEEYVVFLVQTPDGLAPLAGPALTFAVRGRQVTLGGFAGVQRSISLDEFSQLVARLSQRAPSNGPAAATAAPPHRR